MQVVGGQPLSRPSSARMARGVEDLLAMAVTVDPNTIGPYMM